VNGYDIEQLQELINAVKNNPQMGQAVLSSKITERSAFFSEAFIKDFVAGKMKNETSRSKTILTPT